jgi:hypothetical protein
VLEATPDEVRATIERVSYDADSVAAEVRDAVGLPDEYADKLIAAA